MPEMRSVLSETAQTSVALAMHEKKMFGIAEIEEDFLTLKSGRRSPHYFDVRAALSDYATRRFVATTMIDVASIDTGIELSDNGSHFHIAGTPEAMTSYAATMADLSRVSLLQPRANLQKASGNKTPILGTYDAGDTVDLFDDVVTDGESKIDAINAMERAGLDVRGYYVVLDREEGGFTQVKEATGIQIVPAIGVSSLVVALRKHEHITQVQFDNVRRYIDQYGDDHAREVLAA